MKDWHLARGYRYAGIHSGLRAEPGRRDLALVVSDRPAAAAGVFTQNRVAAAPVQVCRERLPSESIRGVVICSGNANACTGEGGLADARRMTQVAAQAIGCPESQMLVCSTGVIGQRLPMAVIEPGIVKAGGVLGGDVGSLNDAAHAILTTDTKIKVSTRRLAIAGGEINITGFAKGAAMIGPNMATMLAFVMTDASASSADLRGLARRAAEKSFNCVSVEGHTSTNDTLLLLANGEGARLNGSDWDDYSRAVEDVCTELARAIAADAEGASHFVTINVEGMRNDAEAKKVAKAVADSPLVKTAIFGADPNWGRIVSAAGYAEVPFEEKDLSLWIDDILLYQSGTPHAFDAAAASSHIKSHREIAICLKFTLGTGRCTFWTCDLTYDYVRLNAEYTT